MRYIVFFILLNFFNLFLLSDKLFAKSAQEYLSIKSISFDKIKEIDLAEPPITSAKKAISYTLNIESIRHNLEKISLKADFVTWNIFSKKNDKLWKVKVRSSGMLPSFTCEVSFNFEGKIIPDNNKTYCRYNK